MKNIFRNILLIRIITLIGFLCMFFCVSYAEIIGHGVYHGYYVIDRWGQKVFHIGPYHLFLSKQAGKKLEKYSGKPLEIKVSKVSQPVNPGGALITEIENVSIKGINMGLIISVMVESNKIKKGKGLRLHLDLRNDSKEEITIHPGTLAIVLVTKTPFSNKDIGYNDPDDISYWRYQDRYYLPITAPTSLFQVACHEILLPWPVQEFISRGRKVKIDSQTKVYIGKNKSYYFPIIIEPDGNFEIYTTVGEELLVGEYEVFFYIMSGNLSYIPGPMSKRISFDVIE